MPRHPAPSPATPHPPARPHPPGAAGQAFLSGGAGRGALLAAPPGPLPPGGALSVPDQVRLRDRSTILARQLYAEQGPAFADGQVAALLAALRIDAAALPGALHHVHDQGWHALWQQQQQQQQAGRAHEGAAAEAAAAAQAAHMEAAWREQQQLRAQPWCARAHWG